MKMVHEHPALQDRSEFSLLRTNPITPVILNYMELPSPTKVYFMRLGINYFLCLETPNNVTKFLQKC